jgi:hypothetical protein
MLTRQKPLLPSCENLVCCTLISDHGGKVFVSWSVGMMT